MIDTARGAMAFMLRSLAVVSLLQPPLVMAQQRVVSRQPAPRQPAPRASLPQLPGALALATTPLRFSAVYFACDLVGFPASVLAPAAGALFRPAVGVAAVLSAGAAAASLAFAIGRSFRMRFLAWLKGKVRSSPNARPRASRAVHSQSSALSAAD